jgi:hypothetical protein
MHSGLPRPELGLSDEEAQQRFDALQRKLVPLWRSIREMNQDEQTIVVVPSLNVDLELRVSEVQAYEERFLFLLLLLRQPRARLVYVTGQAIHPAIVDYYLGLLPGTIAAHARGRLFLVSPLDPSSRSLSLKLLERPRLLQKIRSLIVNPDRAHLVPFNTTMLERELALQLGIPMYATDPRLFPLGTKSGSRRLFAEEGVAHPLGIEDLASVSDVVRAIATVRAKKPGVEEVLVKLNEGVSGDGNAFVDLRGLPAPGTRDEEEGILERLRAMRYESAEGTYEAYFDKLAARGGVVEERIVGKEFRSPSVQLRITPLGEVELLSTHDQLLGGAGGGTYLGCRFPADPAYAALITREARKIGERLVKEGVLGRFALDFVVVRKKGGEWHAYAIELNLRKGGTTHPFLTLQFLTDGVYDPERAVFTAPSGRSKHFVATDHLDSPSYRVFTPEDLFDVVVRRGLHFDQTRQLGVVFHMMSALGECGRMGLTAVGDSPEQADALYRRAAEILEEEARAGLVSPPPSAPRP